MNQSVINSPIVLALNRGWQAIGHRSVRDALVAMAGGAGGVVPALGMNIEYARSDDGWDFSQPIQCHPVSWEDWLDLSIRDFDLSITTPKRAIRVPTVIISPHYAKMPVCRRNFSREAIFERDRGICQYTGQLVPWEEGNLDHVHARSRGGRNSFDNVVWTSKRLNSLKADKLPQEQGLRLIRTPKAPAPVPVMATLKPRHRDWTHFLIQ